MADIIDNGNETAEIFLKAALSKRKPEGPTPCGFCYNCNGPLPGGNRWCDRHCREDWEKREAAQGPVEYD